MKYPFMTLPDETVITHSDIYIEDNVEKIKVYIEQPIESGFCNATCILPEYKWQNISGFTQDQIADFQDMLEKGSHMLIICCSPKNVLKNFKKRSRQLP